MENSALDAAIKKITPLLSSRQEVLAVTCGCRAVRSRSVIHCAFRIFADLAIDELLKLIEPPKP